MQVSADNNDTIACDDIYYKIILNIYKCITDVAIAAASNNNSMCINVFKVANDLRIQITNATECIPKCSDYTYYKILVNVSTIITNLYSNAYTNNNSIHIDLCKICDDYDLRVYHD